MKYRLTFYHPDGIVLPVQYNHILQAALLNWLGDTDYTAFLHDTGYEEGKRKMKLYTFSNLYGRYRYHADIKKIVFGGEISFYCSFYEKYGDEVIQQNIAKEKPLRLGEMMLAFVGCELIEEVNEECIVEAVSPITIHSTVVLPNGKKKTYYYEPYELEFSEMIRQNLIRKYKAIHGCEPEDSRFEIICLPNEKYKPASIYYQRFVIKGWRGRFLLKGADELIELALVSGVGARNGIGCGCILQKKDAQ